MIAVLKQVAYLRFVMLHQPRVPDQAVAKRVRVVALDRARSFITLSVVLYHSVLMWLQLAVLHVAIPAGIKFLIVFGGTLLVSWALTAGLRKIPAVAWMI